jgi:hypothetical protein
LALEEPVDKVPLQQQPVRMDLIQYFRLLPLLQVAVVAMLMVIQVNRAALAVAAEMAVGVP